ncbi:MAG: hypothetical protein A2064_13440 [Spirochaetes bacterium GWB1_66_5]|nr:MAG: hypothetical protein A2064_13440 [Spirochaetes bacterium GWB1_66_5]
MYSVYGICNPLLDMVVYAGFDVLAGLGATPGTMNLIDEQTKSRLTEQVRVVKMVPGGSAANTLRGLAWLGRGAIDRPLYGDYLAYVGIDQWKAGELQGDFFTKKLMPGGGNIVLIIGDPGCPASIGRGNGMLSILDRPENKGKYKILATYKASYNQMLGMQKMEEAIAAFGDKIDLVYCANDSMALGALDALKNAEMDEVLVAGIDGQKEAYAEILKGGQYKSTVINNSWEITQKAVNLLVDYLTKKVQPKEKNVITGTILVTADNVKKFYDQNAVF